MSRKYIWALGALAVVGGAFWLGNYTRDYLLYARDFGALSGLKTVVLDNASKQQRTAPASVATGTPMSTGPVRVTAITPSSITVQATFAQTKTLAIVSDTLVYSTVLAGQTAKGLSDIHVGTKVNVYYNTLTPGKATSLAFARDPSLELTSYEYNLSVKGTITKLSDSEVTITPANAADAPVTIALDSSTRVISVVAAGQKGRGLAVGSGATASGLATAGGKTTAKLITVAPAPSQ